MKSRHHFSLSALLAGLAVYKELWAELPGTGQSVMGLVKGGWTRLEVAEYFPWTAVNGVLLLGAVFLAGRAAWSKTQRPEGAEGEGKRA